MRYGIPNFKLDKRSDRPPCQADGGRRHPLPHGRGDRQGHHAGTICATATTPWSSLSAPRVPRDMKIPGRELKGIHFAMEFLPDATRRVYGVKPVHDITAKDKHVIVIGGGDTGSDCLGTSIRQGAKDVTVLQIMPKEPDERPDNQPVADVRPRLYQKTSSMEEGGDVRVQHRLCQLRRLRRGEGPVCTIDDSTAVRRIRGRRERPRHRSEGRRCGTRRRTVRSPASPVPNACCPRIWCSSRSASCTRTPPRMLDQLPVELDKRGNVARNDKFATSQDGVFVCRRRGPRPESGGVGHFGRPLLRGRRR